MIYIIYCDVITNYSFDTTISTICMSYLRCSSIDSYISLSSTSRAYHPHNRNTNTQISKFDL